MDEHHTNSDGAPRGPGAVASAEPDAQSVATDPVRDEIVRAVENDETNFGDVWRRTEAGETPEQIQQAHGLQNPTFVWNYLLTARAIIDGDIPTAPTVALSSARKLRRLLKTTAFTPATREALEGRLLALEANAADQRARAAEEKETREATDRAEAAAVTGIYVYSLPHYIRYPYDPESGRTLFKVGKADRDSIKRFREQAPSTALPEQPVLLRVYDTGEGSVGKAEQLFHGLLDAAGHDRSKARTGGTDWFLTSLKFLDKIASSFSIPVRDVVPLADEA